MQIWVAFRDEMQPKYDTAMRIIDKQLRRIIIDYKNTSSSIMNRSNRVSVKVVIPILPIPKQTEEYYYDEK
jgi:hypothetical protein